MDRDGYAYPFIIKMISLEFLVSYKLSSEGWALSPYGRALGILKQESGVLFVEFLQVSNPNRRIQVSLEGHPQGG